MLDFFTLPEVCARLSHYNHTVLKDVPVATRKNIYIHPWHLDMGESAKFGVNGKWPSNVAIRTHFPSVVDRGYESEKEALELKFGPESHGKPLDMFVAGYIDGHAKGVMVHAVFALLDYMVPRLHEDCAAIPQMFEISEHSCLLICKLFRVWFHKT